MMKNKLLQSLKTKINFLQITLLCQQSTQTKTWTNLITNVTNRIDGPEQKTNNTAKVGMKKTNDM